MSSISNILKALLPTLQTQRERDDAYLADSADIYDLERRMREIEQRDRSDAPGLLLGLGLR